MTLLSIEDKQAILAGVYELREGLPAPLLVQPFAKWYATRERMEYWALDLAQQRDRNRQQLQVADFSLPHYKTGIGLGAIAAEFVGSCEWNDKSDAWIAPLIGDQPARVYDLNLPDPLHSGLNEFIHRRIAFFQEHGEYPLQPCNIASPLTTASYIWGYSEFLAALIDHPREVHHLLELVTAATIDFVRSQTEAIRDLWALSHEDWWMPPEMGVRVSDDVLAVISPKAYREFGARYNNQLSREFGGIVIHSCGDIAYQIPTILEIENVRAIDLTLPHNNPANVRDAAAGKVALTMRYWLQDWEDRMMPDLAAYTDRMIELFGSRGILLQMETPTLQDAVALADELSRRPWGIGAVVR